MVAKIHRGESPVEEIQQAFKDEVKTILKDAALRMGCTIEQLKYRFDNLGRVEVQKMTPEEMIEEQKEQEKQKRITAICRMRDN